MSVFSDLLREALEQHEDEKIMTERSFLTVHYWSVVYHFDFTICFFLFCSDVVLDVACWTCWSISLWERALEKITHNISKSFKEQTDRAFVLVCKALWKLFHSSLLYLCSVSALPFYCRSCLFCMCMFHLIFSDVGGLLLLFS